MHTLQAKILKTNDFLCGIELVSIRGSMAEKSAVKARDFANQLVTYESVDWVSITDNAGGNPQLAPEALGKPILYAGKEVVIHLTCKDLNRNGLESAAWALNSEGFHNILAMTGDFPISGNDGLAKPVFDIDSVGLISMLTKMNQGFSLQRRGKAAAKQLENTNFLIGAVTSNFKLYEGEVMPQYYKLQKKIECGAHFIINQIGYDSRKIDELRIYMDNHGMKETPLIGNVYMLNGRVAKVFNAKKIPGVVVSDALLEKCEKQGRAEDNGKMFFYTLAAKQMAIYKGLGYRGVYLGGVHDLSDIENILIIEKSFSEDDWQQFVTEISYSRPEEFYFYQKDEETGLADVSTETSGNDAVKSKGAGFSYRLSRLFHDTMFTQGKPLCKIGEQICKNSKNPMQGPKLLRIIEQVSKALLFECKDCGDCSLPDIAYLCPESQCAKNQRNGPCGGTNDGRCEVAGFGDCIWLRAYERLKYDDKDDKLLNHSPVIQDQGLRRTSAWANTWLGRDHTTKKLKSDEN